MLGAGVSCFAWSPALSLGISGGLQREILLWQPESAIATGTLRGHSASVSHLVLDERSNQAPSRTPCSPVRLSLSKPRQACRCQTPVARLCCVQRLVMNQRYDRMYLDFVHTRPNLL